MRRWIAFTALTLTLGALTTIAVAWFAAGVEHLQIGDTVLLERRRYAGVSPVRSGCWGSHHADAMRQAWSLWWDPDVAFDFNREHAEDDRNRHPAWSAYHDGRPWDTAVVESQYGWPMPALRSRVSYGEVYSDSLYEAESLPTASFEGGIPIEGRIVLIDTTSLDERIGDWSTDLLAPERSARLPLTPNWSGLAVDSTLFAIAWAVAALVCRPIFLTRAIVRRVRGSRCVRCGYPLGHAASDRCSECGTPRSLPLPIVTRWRIAGLALIALALASVLVLWVCDRAITERVRSALADAARYSDLQDVRSLVVDPDAWWQSAVLEDDPIWWAARSDDLEVLRVLIGDGWKPNWWPMKTDPLVIAARRGNFRAVATLVAASGEPWSLPAALRAAALADRLDMFEFLVRSRMDADEWLHLANGEADRHAISEALAALAALEDPRAFEHLLLIAKEELHARDSAGSDECVVSIRHGLGGVAVRMSLVYGRERQFEILTADQSPPAGDIERCELLDCSISGGKLESLEMLLRSGLISSLDSCPVVTRALIAGSMPMVDRLLAAGADPNFGVDFELPPPLFVAFELGCGPDVFRTLLDAGADPNLVFDDDTLAHEIHWGTENDGIHTLLLERGMRIDEPAMDDGERPLHRQIHDGSVPGVRRLLAAGADPSLRGDAEHSPIELARQLANLGPTEYQRWTASDMSEIERMLERAVMKGDAGRIKSTAPEAASASEP